MPLIEIIASKSILKDYDLLKPTSNIDECRIYSELRYSLSEILDCPPEVIYFMPTENKNLQKRIIIKVSMTKGRSVEQKRKMVEALNDMDVFYKYHCQILINDNYELHDWAVKGVLYLDKVLD